MKERLHEGGKDTFKLHYNTDSNSEPVVTFLLICTWTKIYIPQAILHKVWGILHLGVIGTASNFYCKHYQLHLFYLKNRYYLF